jgi:hypothetical protein
VAEATCVNGHVSDSVGEGARFCRQCGGALLGRCPNGHTLKGNAAFCATCGAPTPDAARTAANVPSETAVSQASPPPPPPPPLPPPPTSAVPVDTRPDPPASPPPTQLLADLPPPPGSPPTGPPGPVAVGVTSPMPSGPVPKKQGGSNTWLVWLVVGLVVLLGGAATAVVLTSSHNSTGQATATTTQPASNRSHTGSIPTSPSTSTTAATTQALAQSQAAALSGLLAQSSSDRAATVAAAASISSCGDLLTAEGTLDASANSRQSLLGQVQALNLSALPSGTQLTGYLTAAWTNSEASDRSYASWAADEISSGCTPNDTSDVNYQNAQGTDAQSTANKTSFASLWNTIAPTYNLPTVSPSNL